MPHIFILNETNDQTFDSLGKEIRLIDKPTVTVTHQLIDLENALTKDPLDLLVIIVNETPSEDLIHFISKNRNSTFLRNTEFISVHKRAQNAGMQKALMAGAKTLFLEPIDKEKIVQSINRFFNDNPWDKPVLPEFENPPHPIALKANIWGRIGMCHLDSVGDIQIETDVEVPVAKDVVIVSKLAKELGYSHFLYKVFEGSQKDTYYHYENNYFLSWEPTPDQKKKLTNWLAKTDEMVFAIPKTKVLWIRDEPLGAWEEVLDKTVLSVHVQKPGKVTHSYLERLNPRIILTHQLPEITRTHLQTWLDENDPEEKRVISADDFETPEAFQRAFQAMIQPYLVRRVSESTKHAKFFDRKSDYSRCAVVVEGQVLAISRSHLRLGMPFNLAKNTVFLAQCQGLGNHYLKVIASQLHEGRGYRLVCEILPISNTQIISSPMAPKPPRRFYSRRRPDLYVDIEDKPYFIQSNTGISRVSKVLIGLIICVLLGALLHAAIPKFQGRDEGHSQMQKAMKSIRKAFR